MCFQRCNLCIGFLAALTWVSIGKEMALARGAVMDADSSLHYGPVRRGLETQHPAFFDQLRFNLSAADGGSSVYANENSSIYEVALRHGYNPTFYRMAEIKTFTAFTLSANATALIPTSVDEAFAVFLAVHHFNNMQSLGHPVLGDYTTRHPSLNSCNVKLTMELIDTQYSPTKTTQAFTSLSQRQVSIVSPRATAVVGAQRSAETLPLAILTAVKGIPQVSASATSSSFDEKEQFPLFGRTVTSTKGEAAAAVRFFQSIGSTHVAILFVTDLYGSALQRSFREESNKAGLATESFAYDVSASDEDLSRMMTSLQQSQFRHVFAICFEQMLAPILNAAVETNAIGSEYLYIFPSIDKAALQDIVHVKYESPIAQALNGTGLMHMQGGITKETVVLGKQQTPHFNEESEAGFDRFRASWRDGLSNETFVDYVRSKLPAFLDAVPDDFTRDPGNGFLSFNYDSVTALGLSMCLAGENTTFFTGSDIYEQYRRLDFEGASGRVKILSTTGTRDYATIAFTMWNVRILGADSEGYAIVEFAPSVQFQQDMWSTIAGNAFVFAGGNMVAPASLPPVPFNFNYVGNVSRVVGYVLMGLLLMTALGSMCWTAHNRKNPVIDQSNPIFLVLVSVGAFIMASAIVPLAFEETVVESQQTLDMSCMAVPLLYFVGTSIALGALLAKTREVYNAYLDPTLDSVQVTSIRIAKYAVVLVSFNVAVILIWYLVAPMEWTRTPSSDTDGFNRLLKSSAVCTSDNSLGFAVVLIVGNLSAMIWGTILAYKSRNVVTEYNESRYLGICIAAMLQAWLFGIPVLVVVRTIPSASFFVKCGLILVTAGLLVGLVYVPKVMHVRQLDSAKFNPRELYKNWKTHMYRASTSGRHVRSKQNESTAPSTQSHVTFPGSEESPSQDLLVDNAVSTFPDPCNSVDKARKSGKVLIGGIEVSMDELRRMEQQMRDESNGSEEFMVQAELDRIVKETSEVSSSMTEGNSRSSDVSIGSLWKIVEHDSDTGSDQ